MHLQYILWQSKTNVCTYHFFATLQHNYMDEEAGVMEKVNFSLLFFPLLMYFPAKNKPTGSFCVSHFLCTQKYLADKHSPATFHATRIFL